MNQAPDKAGGQRAASLNGPQRTGVKVCKTHIVAGCRPTEGIPSPRSASRPPFDGLLRKQRNGSSHPPFGYCRAHIGIHMLNGGCKEFTVYSEAIRQPEPDPED